ncbi:MAG: cell division protein FtsL [Gammaproteobacteria bacterium]|nr:MAG: cell division protein FtsL [Gammaproteobacteria bacterium]RLA61304.1 MAG: cell division protein FtsL [Gammaproteobacteria bacterium]
MVSPATVQSDRRSPAELFWFNAGTLLLILFSTFAVIHSTHACRALYAQLQVLESSQWYLHEDYGRLLLEQSTWASHRRVEKVARADLGMQAPDLALLKVVPQ